MSRKDLDALQEAGFDAVMFGNENDRPYEFTVDTASTATMAYVIGRVRDRITLPFGVNVLWDPMSSIALAAATGARFVREIFTGTYASDMGPWTPDAGKAMRYRDRLDRQDLALLYNVSAEFAHSLDRRALADRARSAVFSSIPDAILVSGQITGEAAEMGDLEAVKKALPTTPVLANTGVKHATVARCAEDRRRLHRRLVAQGRRRHLERGRSGAGGRVHGHRAQGARRMNADEAQAGTTADAAHGADADPGLSGHEGRVRRAIAAKLQAMGLDDADGPARQSDRHDGGRRGRAERHAVHPYGPARLRGAQDRGGRLHPGRAARRRAGTRAGRRRPCCSASARAGTVPGVIANKSHHATGPDEKYKVVPYQDLYIDAGFSSRDEALAAGVNIGTPVVYRPHVMELGETASPARRSTTGPAAPSCWRSRARCWRRPITADRPHRVFRAGGVQPARRGDGGAGAAARHRHPDRPAARHRHAGHGGSAAM